MCTYLFNHGDVENHANASLHSFWLNLCNGVWVGCRGGVLGQVGQTKRGQIPNLDLPNSFSSHQHQHEQALILR